MGFGYFDQYDQRENANLYCTTEEIDERQCQELTGVLTRWKNKEIAPWDVLLETSYIVGAWVNCLTSYRHALQGNNQEWLKATYSDTDVSDDDLEEISAIHRAEIPQHLEKLQSLLRPEILERDVHETAISGNIQSILDKLESTEFNSWDTARAIVEVILAPSPDDDPYNYHPQRNFLESIERSQENSSKDKTDNETSLAWFEPASEASIKQPLARLFAAERAYQTWKTEQELKGEDGSRWRFGVWGDYEEPPEEAEVPFIPPIDYPTRRLCNGIEIVPSGTGLIQLASSDDSCDDIIYGNPIARITTYSITLIAKNPEDCEELKTIVQQALKVLGTTPYPYKLPGNTESGTSYKRINARENGLGGYDINATSYVENKDGRIQPQACFDLDDLWVLYYLLEPVIEPNEQIAAAMNAARYAEERGAILQPKRDYLYEGHGVENDNGYLQATDPDQLLAKAFRDNFIALSLGEINEAEFMVRVGTLADHTLTGRIQDPNGELKTFDKLLTDQRETKGEITSYETAWSERTQELLRRFLGIEKDSQIPLRVSLIAAMREVAEPLKQLYRQRDRQESAEYSAYFAEQRRIRAAHSLAIQRRRANGEQISFMEEMGIHAMLDDRERDLKLSDAVSGYREPEKGFKETALAIGINLVVSDSEVETCIDGIQEYGYRSRTKGSPFVRKAMPASLLPFCPQQNNRPTNLKVLLNAPSLA